MLGRRDTALTIALRSYQARHFSSCRKACQDVLDHDPRDAVALHLLGMSAFSEKNLDEAIGYLVEAASAEPSSLEIRTNLGLALRVAGRLEAAEEQFRLALSQAPDTPSLMNELALTLIDQERMGEAEGMLERAAILAPGQADVRNSLGILRLRQRRFLGSLCTTVHGHSNIRLGRGIIGTVTCHCYKLTLFLEFSNFIQFLMRQYIGYKSIHM